MVTGPTQLVPYVLVRVQERLHKDRTLGALLIEPTFCRVTFNWADGRTESSDRFTSEEIGHAVAEADRQLESEPGTVGEQWLGGVAGAFEPRWGELVLIERSIMSLPSLEMTRAEVDQLLSVCIDSAPIPN